MNFSQKISLALISVISCIVLTGAPALADPSAYLTAVGGNLISFDATTGTFNVIGNTSQNLMEGLALSPGGVLYGTDDSGNLFSIDQTTGAATTIGNTGLAGADVEGLVFDGNTLIGSNFMATASSLYTINTTTAAATLLVTSDLTAGPIRAMTIQDANTVLVSVGNSGSAALYSINLTTGGSHALGSLPSNFVTGLAFLSDGNFYGAESNGDISQINPATGAGVTVANDPGTFFLDMTSIPGPASTVPEPSALMPFALAGLGLLGLVWRARRARTL